MEIALVEWQIGALAVAALLSVLLLFLVISRLIRKAKTAAPPPVAAEQEVEPQIATLILREASEQPASPPPSAQPVDIITESEVFAIRQFMRNAENELEQMRAELTELWEEVARLRAFRQTSPHYAEAMALAGEGVDVETMAEQCGISLAEAELVLALSKGDGLDEI